jgi:hypothetical protein
MIAIVIVAVPEILVAFIAALLIMAGIGVLYIGHWIRKSEIEFRDFDYRYFDDVFFGLRFNRIPISRCRRW